MYPMFILPIATYILFAAVLIWSNSRHNTEAKHAAKVQAAASNG